MFLETIASPLRWQDRPEPLKRRIDTTFEALSEEKKSSWGFYNGFASYEMLTASECKYFKAIIQKAPKEQKEFYLLDIGAGNFQLIRHMVQYINEQTDIPEDITVHVIGVRGEGGEGGDKRIGKCQLYELTAFKVEEMSNEFIKRDLPLEKRVDFIISRWCFRHLNDPLGTFVQAYNLLRPQTGVLIIDGFFSLNKNQKIEEILQYHFANGAMIDLFVRTKAPFLMQSYRETRSLNRFMLQRHDDSPCRLYMSYLDNFQTEGMGEVQVHSNCITRFDKGIELADLRYFKPRDGGSRRLYGDKRLYDWLRKNYIIDLDIGWGATANDAEDRFRLHQAVREGRANKIEECLKMGDDIDEVDFDGYTPLHLAMKEQKMECFKLLLEKGADDRIPSCNVIKHLDEYLYGGEEIKDNIDVEDVTLLWEAEKMCYNEEYINILQTVKSSRYKKD